MSRRIALILFLLPSIALADGAYVRHIGGDGTPDSSLPALNTTAVTGGANRLVVLGCWDSGTLNNLYSSVTLTDGDTDTANLTLIEQMDHSGNTYMEIWAAGETALGNVNGNANWSFGGGTHGANCDAVLFESVTDSSTPNAEGTQNASSIQDMDASAISVAAGGIVVGFATNSDDKNATWTADSMTERTDSYDSGTSDVGTMATKTETSAQTNRQYSMSWDTSSVARALLYVAAWDPEATASTCISNNYSPQPGDTIAISECPAFAGSISTLQEPNGDSITADGSPTPTTTTASFTIPARDNFASGQSMNNTEWGQQKTWTVGDGSTTQDISLTIDPPNTAGTDFFGQMDRTAPEPGDSMFIYLCNGTCATADDYYFEENSGTLNITDDGIVTGTGGADLRWFDDSSNAWSTITVYNFTLGSSAPVISALTVSTNYGDQELQDVLSLSVQTDSPTGSIFYCVKTIGSLTTGSDVETCSGGADSGSITVNLEGAYFTDTGALADGTYYVYAVHKDSNNSYSNVLSDGDGSTEFIIDTTGLTLTNISHSVQGANEITAQVTISGGTSGTLFCNALPSATVSDTEVTAGGYSSTISATGVKSITMTGLTAGDVLWSHCYAVDPSGNGSSVLTTTSAIEVLSTEFITSENLQLLFEDCGDGTFRRIGNCP